MAQEGCAGEQWAVATGMAQPYLQFSLAVLLGPRSELAQVSETVTFGLSQPAHNGLKSYVRLSRVFSRRGASLFQNPVDAFRHTCQCVGLSMGTRERRYRIFNCGDLSYILANLGAIQINLLQLLNRLNLRGLQGFPPSIQQVTFSFEMVSGTRARCWILHGRAVVFTRSPGALPAKSPRV